MTERESFDVMAYIFAEYDVSISENRRRVWFDQIKHLDFETAMSVARVLLARKSFGVPRVSDFMEALKDFAEIGKLSLEEAWNVFYKTVLRFGRYQKTECLAHMQTTYPELVIATSSLFNELCDAAPSDIPALRAHFWKMLQSKHEKDHKQRALLGGGGKALGLTSVAKIVGELPIPSNPIVKTQSGAS